jgi:hypothetical protein
MRWVQGGVDKVAGPFLLLLRPPRDCKGEKMPTRSTGSHPRPRPCHAETCEMQLSCRTVTDTVFSILDTSHP